MSEIVAMRQAGAEPGQLAEAALGDDAVLAQLLAALEASNKDSSLRYACEQALLAVAAQAPGRLVPHWDYFVQLLNSPHAYAMVNGLYMVSALAGEMDEERVRAVLPRYLQLLDDQSIMVAGHVAHLLGKLARAKPGLAAAIAGRLVELDSTHHSPERKELIAIYAIPALGECFEVLEDKERVLAFVAGRRTSGNPRTRKAANAFLKRYGEGGPPPSP